MDQACHRLIYLGQRAKVGMVLRTRQAVTIMDTSSMGKWYEVYTWLNQPQRLSSYWSLCHVRIFIPHGQTFGHFPPLPWLLNAGRFTYFCFAF